MKTTLKIFLFALFIVSIYFSRNYIDNLFETNINRNELSNSWQTLKNCSVSSLKYEPDGDSFEVKFDGGTEVFRLWGIDCPETSAKSEVMKDRVREQAFSFKKSFDQTIWWGQIAKNFTISKLKEGFYIETRWQKCFKYRYYCKVKLISGEDLGDLLLKKGYARVVAGHLPSIERERLYLLEKQAKDEKIGIWAKQQ